MAATAGPEQVQAKAGELLGQMAGYVGFRTVEIGLRHGLLEALASDRATTPAQLAETVGLDPFYVEVWCRAACAAGVIDPDGEGYRLAGGVDTLLLDRDAPGYLGAVFTVLEQPEIFDEFSRRLPTGERTWWDRCSPDFIRAVAGTGRPFYTRAVPDALERVPGLAERLAGGGRVLELASGAGVGLERLARAFPAVELVGVDGDQYSLDLARKHVDAAGIGDRVELVRSPLEELDEEERFDLAFISISMHECRDIERTTANVHRALKPGGLFVISDFPFPETTEGLRSVPGRVMSGIQFFEAMIDDQLLPTSAYLELLERHGFSDVASFELTPVHVVVHGSR